MANIQSQFTEFHDEIRLAEENDDLRLRRDLIVDILRSKLGEYFKNKGGSAPTFDEFNQGSYAMHTGTMPIEGDFDIDVGLRFKFSKDDYPNPVEVKKWICDALIGQTHKPIEIKEPCVRVIYSLDDVPDFHVDLAIYSSAEANVDGKTYFARGKDNSAPEDKRWEEADPQGLLKAVNEHYPGDDEEQERQQFRRVIRYMKRWKDLNFVQTGHSSPVGIGLTLVALQHFTPQITKNGFTGVTTADDLSSLIQLVSYTINGFQPIPSSSAQALYRFSAHLPVAPYTDVFAKMSDLQMTEFKNKLQNLKEELEFAGSEPDLYVACKRLNSDNVFGDDFPVPAKVATGIPRSKAYPSDGQSG